MKPMRYVAYACSLLCACLGLWLYAKGNSRGSIFFTASVYILLPGRRRPQPLKAFWTGSTREWITAGSIIVGSVAIMLLILWVLPAMGYTPSPSQPTLLGGVGLFIFSQAASIFVYYGERKELASAGTPAA